ncbi:MAG: DUF3592 domain-containing protein [Methylobacter sp.]|jgi:hypothetical protein|nr:DUF3592 domain-containing protein [Methylobacter sp.]
MMVVIRITFLLLGAFLVLFGLVLRRMNAKAASWPSTEGEITRSDVVVDPHDGGSSAEIKYSYVVDGDNFSSGQFSFGVRDNSPAKEQLLAEVFPVGRKVSVYYDPGNPSIAVVETRPSSGWTAIVAAGAVCVGVGLLAP